MSTQANYLSYKSGVNAVTDKEPVDYVQLAFQTRLYLEVALRALSTIAKGDLAVNSQETAKKVLQDLEVVEYKREWAELVKLEN